MWDEDKHPRDSDGKFSGKGQSYRANTSYSEIMDGAQSFPKDVPTASKFNRRDTKHHTVHAKEMGFKNQKEYEIAAVEFWNKDDGETFVGTKRNDYAKYNAKTEEYAVCRNDGIIKTYYKMNRKKFEKKKQQEGYKNE